MFHNRRETVYYKLEYRDLWSAVGELTMNDYMVNYDDLNDDNKNNVKTIFKQMNEQINFDDINVIVSNGRTLKIIVNEGELMYKFEWEYEKINYTKYYNDDS